MRKFLAANAVSLNDDFVGVLLDAPEHVAHVVLDAFAEQEQRRTAVRDSGEVSGEGLDNVRQSRLA